ncbi:hypothetical protein OF376_00450 [Ureaplasma miroungigenitalium]|uniref:ECM-binding protein homolog n=1 Tax=Ureaplasma miroungigenitalium TaxID=1042321 RepID=A0ABT3BLY3_9BACT|nr:hypothetical protein [Ureaplasma miroungigenitalium]MCV3728260.1 hypothetical protein [Ureaplasma miroungigenitalium]
MSNNTNKNKRRKLKIGLGIAAALAIPAIAAAIAVPLLLNSKTELDSKIKTGHIFDELDQQKNAADKFITDKNLTEREPIEKAILYAKQLLANEQSPIKLMVEQRNKLAELELRTTLLNEPTVANAQRYLDLFILADTRAEAQSVIETFDANNIKGFLSTIIKVFEKEKSKLLPFETTMFTFMRMYDKNEYGLSMNHQVGDLNQLTKYMIGISKNKYLTFDEITQFETLYNRVYNEASIKTSDRTEKFSSITKVFDKVLKEIAASQLDNDIKLTLNEEVNNLLHFVQKNQNFLDIPVLDLNNQETTGFDIIKNHLSLIINNVAAYFVDDNKIRTAVNDLVDQLKTIKSTLPAILAKQVDTILEQLPTEQKTTNELFTTYNTLSKQLNQVKVANNILLKTQKEIETAQQANVISPELANTLKNKVNDLQFKDFLTYIAELNDMISVINAHHLLMDFNNEQITRLKDEALFIEKNLGRLQVSNETLNALNEHIAKLNQTGIHEINNTINEVRTICKQVLNKILPLVQTELSGDFVLDDFKTAFSKQQPIYQEYASAYSLATRDQLKTAVLWTIDFYDALRVSRQKEESRKYINEVIKGKAEESFVGEGTAKVKKQLIDKLDVILNQMNIIEDNRDLTLEEKQKKIADLTKHAKNLESKIEQIASLGSLTSLVQNELDALEESSNVKEIKAQLASRLKKINNLVAQAKDALDDPTENNLVAIQIELNDEFSKFQKEKAEFNARSDFSRIKKLVQQTYSSFRVANESQTPLEGKILAKLEKLRNDIINPPAHLNEKDKEIYRNKLRAEMDVIASEALLSAQYEKTVANNAAEIEKAQNLLNKLNSENVYNDLSTQNPNPITLKEDIAAKQEALNAIKAKFNKLYKQQASNEEDKLIPVISKDELTALKKEADKTNQLIKLDIAKARLIADTYELNKLKVEPTNPDDASQNPYKKMQEQLDLINRKKNELLQEIAAKIADPNINDEEVSKLVDQVNALDSSIASQNALAKKLWEAFNVYKELTSAQPVKYPEYAKELGESIVANALAFDDASDSEFKRAQKMINLDKELNKRDNAQKTKDLLNSLINLRINQNKVINLDDQAQTKLDSNNIQVDANNPNRLIYQAIDVEMQAKIKEYQAKIENPQTTVDEYARMMINIQSNLTTYRYKKNTAATALDDSITKIKNLFTVNKTHEEANEIDLNATGEKMPYLIALENWFNTIISDGVIDENEALYTEEFLKHFKTIGDLRHNDASNGFFDNYTKQKADATVNAYRPVGDKFNANIDVAYVEQFANLINLAYAQDLYVKKMSLLKANVDQLKETEANLDAYSSIKLTHPTPSEVHESLIAELTKTVVDVTKPDQLAAVNSALNKIAQLDKLIQKQRQVATKITNINNNPDREKLALKTDELIKSLNENKPVADSNTNKYPWLEKTDEGNNSSNEEINNHINKLNDSFNNAGDLNDTKQAIEAEIVKLENRFKSVYRPEVHDKQVEEALWSEETLEGKIKGLIAGYRQELKELGKANPDGSIPSLAESKKRAVEIQNNINTVEVNLSNLLNLAETVKKTEDQADNAPKEKDASVAKDNLDLIEGIKKEIEKATSDARHNYDKIDTYKDINKTVAALNDLANDLSEAEKVRENYIKATKYLAESTNTYHQIKKDVSDAAQNTDTKAKAQAYLDFYVTAVNSQTTAETRMKELDLRRVNLLLEKALNLYQRQQARYTNPTNEVTMNTWKTVHEDKTFATENAENYWWFANDPQNQSASYFNPFTFEKDAFLLSKIIVDTVPKTPENTQKVDEAFFAQEINSLNDAINNELGIAFDNTYNTYTQRKALIDLILDKTNAQAYYQSDYAVLTSTEDEFLKNNSKAYDQLKTAMNMFYYQDAASILNALKDESTHTEKYIDNQKAIASNKNKIIRIHSLLTNYVDLAQAVQKDHLLIDEFLVDPNAENPQIKEDTDPQMKATIQLLLAYNSKVKEYYYKNDNLGQVKALEQKILRLSARIKIIKAYIERKQLLDKTSKEQNTWLTVDFKAALENILEHVMKLVNESEDTSETAYNKYYQQLITGDLTSFDTSFANAKKLAELINEAKKFSNTQSINNKAYAESSTEMKDLYNQLDVKITAAENALKNKATGDTANAWLESQKTIQGQIETLLFEIGDDSRGIINALKVTKTMEVKQLRQQADELNRYIKDNYTDQENSPLLTERNKGGQNNDQTFNWENDTNPFKQTANIQTFDDLKTWTANLDTWKLKIHAQIDRLVSFEKNRLRAIRNRAYVFLNYLNGTMVNAQQELNTHNDADLTKLFPAPINTYLNSEEEIKVLIRAIGLDITEITKAIGQLTTANDNLLASFEIIPGWNSDKTSVYEQFMDPLNDNYYQKALRIKYINQAEALNKTFNSFISIAFSNLAKQKVDLLAFSEQLATDPAQANNLRAKIDEIIKVLKHIQPDNAIVNEILTKLNTIKTTADALKVFDDLGVIDLSEKYNYNQNELDQTLISKRNKMWNNFADLSKKVVDNRFAIYKTIYGNDFEGWYNSSKDKTAHDVNSLRKIAFDFVDSRKELAPMINLLSSSADKKTYFKELIDAYNNTANSIASLKSDIDSKLQGDLLVTELQNNLSKIYDAAVDLNRWMLATANQQKAFAALNDEKNTSFAVKDDKLVEDFEQIVKNWETDQTRIITKDNKSYLWINKDSKDIEILKEYYTQFAFLVKPRGPEDIYSSNVRVYLVKDAGESSYTKTYLQADTAFKKIKVNLMYEYVPPLTNKDIPNNIFWNVPAFKFNQDDVFITFRTQDTLKITKEFLTNSNIHTWLQATRAGWNNKTLIYNYVNALIKQIAAHEAKNNLTFLKNNADPNVQNDPKDTTNGVEIKFKTTEAGIPVTIKQKTYHLVNYKDETNQSYVYWNSTGADVKGDGNNFEFWTPFYIAVPVVAKEDSNIKGIIFMFFEAYSGRVGWRGVNNDVVLKPSVRNHYELYPTVFLDLNKPDSHLPNNTNPTTDPNEYAEYYMNTPLFVDKHSAARSAREHMQALLNKNDQSFKDGLEDFYITVKLHPESNKK